MNKNRSLVIRIACVIVLITFVSLFAILKTSPTTCEAITKSISRFYTSIISKLSIIVPFSLTELAFVSLAVGLVFLFIFLIKALIKKNFIGAINRLLEGAIIVLLTVSFYDISCECAYNRKALPLPYYESEVLRTEHVAIYNYFADDVNACVNALEFRSNGDVKAKMSLEELTDEIKKSYAIIDDNDYFHSHFGNVKPMASSFIYTEFQITGVTYSPLSEANINITNTMSNIPLTIAHELAHTKGVMREDDANKLAFYVCLNSEHPFLRYSAYCSYFYQIEGMVTSYYLTDEEKQELHKIDDAFYKTRSYVYKFWQEHDLLGDIGDFINDLYLKMSGTKEGTSSYQGGTSYEHDPLTSKLIPSLYQKIFFEKYYR